MRAGSFEITGLLRATPVCGTTVTGVEALGIAVHFEVSGPHGLHVHVRDVTWNTLERDVVACDRLDSPQVYDTLVDRLRLCVLDREGLYVDLRQARLRANGHAGLFDASLKALSTGAGVAVETALRRAGAERVGSRAELLQDSGPARCRIGARLARDCRYGPVMAYVLTRLAPVANGLRC